MSEMSVRLLTGLRTTSAMSARSGMSAGTLITTASFRANNDANKNEEEDDAAGVNIEEGGEPDEVTLVLSRAQVRVCGPSGGCRCCGARHTEVGPSTSGFFGAVPFVCFCFVPAARPPRCTHTRPPGKCAPRPCPPCVCALRRCAPVATAQGRNSNRPRVPCVCAPPPHPAPPPPPVFSSSARWRSLCLSSTAAPSPPAPPHPAPCQPRSSRRCPSRSKPSRTRSRSRTSASCCVMVRALLGGVTGVGGGVVTARLPHPPAHPPPLPRRPEQRAGRHHRLPV